VEAFRFRGRSSERLAPRVFVVTSGGANKLLELCGAREGPLGNNHRRQSVGVDVGVRRGRDHSFHGPPGGGGLLCLARTGHALGGNGDAVRTEQSPILSLAHHPGDILAESAAIRPGEVEQVSGHEAEQGEQIEECPPRTAPVVCQIPNATANEEPDESRKQPRAPVVPSGGGRVKMVIEIERDEVVLGDFVFGGQWRWMVRGSGLARKLGERGSRRVPGLKWVRAKDAKDAKVRKGDR